MNNIIEILKKFNLIEKISIFVLLILFIFVNDKTLIIGIPFLLLLIYSFTRDKAKREVIIENIGIVGVVLYLLGFSFSDYSSNRGSWLMILSFLFQIFYKKKKIEFGEKKIMYMFFFILIFGCIWTSFSYDGVNSIGRFIKVNKRFLETFLMLNIIKEKRQFIVAEKTFILGALIVAIYYMLDYILNYNIASIHVNYRCEGFKNVTYSAGILMMGSMYLFGKIWEIKTIKEIYSKYIDIISFIIIFIGLILTKLRASLLGIGSGIIFIIIFSFDWKKVLLLFLLGSSLIFVVPDTIIERVRHITIEKSIKSVNTGSDNMRRIMWQGSVYTWKNNKIFGAGARGTKYWVQKFADENTDKNGKTLYGFNREEFTYGEAHSIYLNMLAETGIFSILYFIQLFIFIPSLVLKSLKANKNKGEKLGAIVGMISYYIMGAVWSLWGYYGAVQSIFQFMLFILIYFYLEDLQNKRKEIIK